MSNFACLNSLSVWTRRNKAEQNRGNRSRQIFSSANQPPRNYQDRSGDLKSTNHFPRRAEIQPSLLHGS